MSMKTSDLPLNERLAKELADKFMRTSIAKAQDLLNQKRDDAFTELGNYEQWRENAAAIRSNVLENLDYYLNQFVDKAVQNGARVYFARTAEEATGHALGILGKIKARKVVKSKSMVTEEIGLERGA